MSCSMCLMFACSVCVFVCVFLCVFSSLLVYLLYVIVWFISCVCFILYCFFVRVCMCLRV